MRRHGDAQLWTRNQNNISDRARRRRRRDTATTSGRGPGRRAGHPRVRGRLSFDALQQRLVTSPAKARSKASAVPASYAAFDLLAVAGVALRTQCWRVRRQRLEQLAGSWLPSLQLTPVTADIDEARDWFEVLPAAMGVEGIVAKGAASRYTPGRRDAWIKVNSVRVAVFDELTRGTFDQVSHGSRVA